MEIRPSANPLLAGIDIGGSKTHLMLSRGRGRVAEQVLATDSWRSRRAAADAQALVAIVRALAGGTDPQAIVVGAHGCDSARLCQVFQNHIAALVSAAVLVVNDAELLLPAAGFRCGVGVVAGTGSIAVARKPDGTMLVAGGWGWLLGDEGSAPGLVREAARAVRGALDCGEAPDALSSALMASLGTEEPIELGRLLLAAGGAAALGRHARAVFGAAESGSLLAREVIGRGGEALAVLVQRLVRRGAAARHVVTGGGVISHQPMLMGAFRNAMARMLPDAELILLRGPPVAGALALADRIVAGEPLVGMPRPCNARVADSRISTKEHRGNP